MGALQAAGAEEAGRLAAQQQRELQETIAQKKEALAALERWVKCDCHRYDVRTYVCTCVGWMIMYVRMYCHILKVETIEVHFLVGMYSKRGKFFSIK